MFSALEKAFGQLSDPEIKRVMKFGVLAALLVFLGLCAAAWLGVSALAAITGAETSGWIASAIDWVLAILGGSAAVIIALLLFPTVVMTVTGLFAEDVARAVEAKHYPGLPEGRAQPLYEAMVQGLKFAGTAVLLNLLFLPFYLVLPGLNLLLYYSLNGYLLGREFWETAALRRLEPKEAKALWRKRRVRLIVAGALIAFGLTIPILNLFVPVLAIAFMVHLFQTLQAKEQG